MGTGVSSRSLGGRRQDRGFAAQFALLAGVLRGEVAAPSPDGFVLWSLVTLLTARSLESGHEEPVFVPSRTPDPVATV